MASQAAGVLGDQGHAQLMQLCFGSGAEQLNLKKVCLQRKELHAARYADGRAAAAAVCSSCCFSQPVLLAQLPVRKQLAASIIT
jgi:hypothetical protein